MNLLRTIVGKRRNGPRRGTPVGGGSIRRKAESEHLEELGRVEEERKALEQALREKLIREEREEKETKAYLEGAKLERRD